MKDKNNGKINFQRSEGGHQKIKLSKEFMKNKPRRFLLCKNLWIKDNSTSDLKWGILSAGESLTETIPRSSCYII